MMPILDQIIALNKANKIPNARQICDARRSHILRVLKTPRTQAELSKLLAIDKDTCQWYLNLLSKDKLIISRTIQKENKCIIEWLLKDSNHD